MPLAFILALAVGQTTFAVEDPTSPPSVSGENAVYGLVQVLDVNATHAAVKTIHRQLRHPEDDTEPHDCRYPGLEKYPRFGVTLTLVELKTGTTTRFDVYDDAWHSSECTPFDKSKALLAKAKAAFEKAGLDITRKPTAILPQQDTFKLGGAVVKGVSARLGSKKGEDDVARVRLELRKGATTLYRRTIAASLGGAASSALHFHSAYATSAGFVFLEEQTHTAYGSKFLSYTLSPPIQVQ